METQNLKYPKQYFCEDHWEENSGNVWKDLKAIWGSFSVLKVLAPIGPMLTKKKNIRQNLGECCSVKN